MKTFFKIIAVLAVLFAAVVAYAYYDAAQERREFNNAMIMSGGYSGMTYDQYRSMKDGK